MMRIRMLILAAGVLCSTMVYGQKKNEKQETDDAFKSSTFSGLKLRSIGPALTSGRIADLAVNPENPSEYYVAAASGGVWKTVNRGTTFEPIFDGQGSYSIGCITIDPSNPNRLWVGSGENNGQRSVAYGDGIYRSDDGGKSWKNVGLKTSEHIGKILVDPRNSNVVYVAAQGPLWKAGGERGLYKTTDGGATWTSILEVDEHTGVTDIAFDPRNPDLIYAATYQRRRHVWTFISGGPGSALHKSTDGGKSWEKLEKGLPKGDLGRIAIAVSPVKPDMVYAMIEASNGKGGFFRSMDRGASWDKRSDQSTSGNYYQELFCDPVDADRVYAMDTWAKVTNDGGKSFNGVGEKHKHVDNHAMWIDPTDTRHLMMGCDGGLYETWDLCKTWHFRPNLPITQFYKVAIDDAEPFYYVYGGTQDNFSIGGPSQTKNASGIVNSDWFITNGGDGFEPAVDPTDPNIVYSQSQYGWLVRYDRTTGEKIGIKPMEGKDDKAYRWNWDAPLLISPHSHTRLYFAANKLFRSDDRGNTWTAISEDLTQQIDRNKLKVMGRVWSMDAVAKNASTTIYGNIVALHESPVQEDLLYVGTDDGLVQITADAGKNWNKVSSFPGVPANTYVNCLTASSHEAKTVYAAFNNHKNGDFKPYLLKSTDAGKSWTSIAADLPKRGSVYTIVEDPVDPKLLFVGTEFGLFFTVDGGSSWLQLKGGLPTIAVRDLEIQARENDLVLATFGRGFYVLDNYAPLRNFDRSMLDKEAAIFPVKEALSFVPAKPLGLDGKSFQGESFYTAKNPAQGATFSYYMKEGIKTRKDLRKEKEKEQVKQGQDVSYPSSEEMRLEDREQSPFLIFTIRDANNQIVRRLKKGASKGIHRITWDLRYSSTNPASLREYDNSNPFASGPKGRRALPGTYTVELAKSVDGKLTVLTDPVPFKVKVLNGGTLPVKDLAALKAFHEQVAEMNRVTDGAGRYLSELRDRVKYLNVAVREAPQAPLELLEELRTTKQKLDETSVRLNGDRSLSKREFETKPSVSGRVGTVLYNLWYSTSDPTNTHRESIAIAEEELKMVLSDLETINRELNTVEQKLEAAKAPWTPGRLPVMQNK